MRSRRERDEIATGARRERDEIATGARRERDERRKAMRVNRLGVALQAGLHALLALALAIGASLLLQGAGAVAMLSALQVLLTLFFFVALSLLRALSLSCPRPYRYTRGNLNWFPPRGPRPGPPFGGNFGGGPGGVREPRRPYPPHMPPRAAAAEPEPTEQ